MKKHPKIACVQISVELRAQSGLTPHQRLSPQPISELYGIIKHTFDTSATGVQALAFKLIPLM